MLTSFDPAQACGIGNLSLTGLDAQKVAAHLWAKHRIFVTPIKHDEFEGLRITPNLFTTLEELDSLTAAIDKVIEKGLS